MAILVVGHRGGSQLAPENTFAAFDAGIAAGADMVECDVHVSLDGELIVMHDGDVSRTTQGHGNIRDLRLAYLRTLNAAAKWKGPAPVAPQAVPTLADLFDHINGRVPLQIEVKTPDKGRYAGIEAKIAAELWQAKGGNVAALFAFNPDVVRTLSATLPHHQVGFIASAKSVAADLAADPTKLLAYAHQLGASFVALEHTFVAPEHVRAATDLDMYVTLWTVNTEVEIQHGIASGAQALASDRPDLLRRAVDAVAGKP